jgi:hypothetical protein
LENVERDAGHEADSISARREGEPRVDAFCIRRGHAIGAARIQGFLQPQQTASIIERKNARDGVERAGS